MSEKAVSPKLKNKSKPKKKSDVDRFVEVDMGSEREWPTTADELLNENGFLRIEEL